MISDWPSSRNKTKEIVTVVWCWCWRHHFRFHFPFCSWNHVSKCPDAISFILLTLSRRPLRMAIIFLLPPTRASLKFSADGRILLLFWFVFHRGNKNSGKVYGIDGKSKLWSFGYKYTWSCYRVTVCSNSDIIKNMAERVWNKTLFTFDTWTKQHQQGSAVQAQNEGIQLAKMLKKQIETKSSGSFP